MIHREFSNRPQRAVIPLAATALAVVAWVPAIGAGPPAELGIGLEPGGHARLDMQPLAPGPSAVLEATATPGAEARWAPVWATRSVPATWVDPDREWFPRRVYRLRTWPRAEVPPHASWKPRVALPDDPFLADPLPGVGTGGFAGSGETRWVKFTILREDPTTVYFQDSAAYPFHYEFGVAHLPALAGLDREAFDRATLDFDDQVALLGAVLVDAPHQEFAIQFVGREPIPRESLAFFHQLVLDSLDGTIAMQGFHFPTFEQSAAAEAGRDYLASRDIRLGSASRWVSLDQCYAEGWAIGRLVFVTGGQIAAAYRSGALTPADILMTDRVPSELPFVAGVITAEPATPNSHAVLLARAWGIPFAHVADETAAAALAAQAGRDFLFQAGGWQCAVQPIGLPDDFPPALHDELAARKQVPPLALTPVAVTGEAWRAVDGLVPADVDRFGGKAAHFGLLRRVLPDHSPTPAIALSFDLWDAFLAQPVAAEGRPLRAAIDARLAGVSWPPDDLDALLDELAAIRGLIADGGFAPADRATILGALAGAGFDPGRKIRFRSSTNVEDQASFVGAGLYDSYSGCLMDDLDDDELGPSHCNPDEPKERGVLRAIRKVYASFYNDNAYLERLRRGVDEQQVGMAVLVHHSFPDPLEMANGVATLHFEPPYGGGGLRMEGELVSQLGAVSVTNPDGSATPEVMRLSGYQTTGAFQVYPSQLQRSSLLQLGRDQVLAWQDEYRSLGTMLFEVGKAYATLVGRTTFTLDFEFKKMEPGNLVVKQVREIPEGAGDGGVEPPVLVGVPLELQLFQGEAGDIFANHRLKSRWTMTGANRLLDAAGLRSSLIAAAEWTHLLEGAPQTTAGTPADWPGAAFSVEDGTRTLDRWDGHSAQGGATRFTLETNTTVYQPPGPGRTLAQFTVHLHADYADPVAPADPYGDPRSDVVRLEPARATEGPLPPGSMLQTRRIGDVTTTFWWPPAPSGPTAGYTAPLERWEETVISGLTSRPIVLRGYWSQTYRPGHHNFTEEFLFEPRLEEGIAPDLIAELEAKDIRLVYAATGFSGGGILVAGADGQLRKP